MADNEINQSGAPKALCEGGAEVWAAIAPGLSASGRLKQTDEQALARYCDLVHEYWALREAVREEGRFILVPTIAKNEDGTPGMMRRRNPALTEIKQLLPELKHLEDRFGLSPLSRNNLVARMIGGSRPGAGDGLVPANDPAPQGLSDQSLSFADPAAFG